MSYTDYLTTGIWEAGVFAEGQLSSLEAAAKVYNVGYLDQEETTMTLTVNGTGRRFNTDDLGLPSERYVTRSIRHGSTRNV